MTSGPTVGTLQWTRQTEGILSWRDRATLLGQGCLYLLATLPAELRRGLGIRRRRLARIDATELTPPDTRAADEAAQLVAALAPPVVVEHSHRTFAFGTILARHDGLAFDSEAVYVASLLHDLCFADPSARPHPHCFTHPAAERTLSLLADAGWDTERAELTAEAITLHLNLRPPRESAEAYAVYAGARLDVAGYRLGDIDPETLADVLVRHPRASLKREFTRMMSAQATANPGSRAAFYTHRLGANRFTRRAPFAE